VYDFSKGPLVWIAFGIFLIGSIYRIIMVIKLSKKDKVVLPYMTWKYGLRSILHWITPFGTRNMRLRPAFTVMTYLFHLSLLLVPIFTLGHAILWRESWGIDWWALPNLLSKLMTFIVIIAGVIFVLRRIADPTVRFVTSAGDIFLVIVVLAPFVTGLMAYYQLAEYQAIIIIHIWTGALWLAIIPFTRIAHMLYFALTRAYMGCEFGYVRHSKDW
jgi:nitrate reductase gamma subunit